MHRTLLLFLLVVACALPKGWGQATGPHTCATAAQFCADCELDIQSTSTSSFEQGPNYQCLSYYLNNPSWYTQRAVVWFYFRIKEAGDITITLSCPSPSPDFVCWGPYNYKPQAGNLTSLKVVACNDDNHSSKTFTIQNAQQDKFYMVAVSYFFQGTHLIVEKTGGTATTYCPSDVTITTSTGSTEICEGEAITLTASSTPVEFYSPGDILCTDGSIVKYANWPVSGKTAKAVVFYVDETGLHGWAVKKTEKQATWSSETVVITGLPSYTNWIDAISDMDGYANTQKIRNKGNSTKYPAAWAVDFSNGWYLPAVGQLNVLYGELIIVNQSITKIGGGNTIQLNNSAYHIWSSTGSSNQYSMMIQCNNGLVGYDLKSRSNYIREVINF